MASVTRRILEIKQPNGSYLSPREFKKIQLDDGKQLFSENVHWSIVGMAVDYLTRFMIDKNTNPAEPIEKILRKAFAISIKGYEFRTILTKRQLLKQDQANGVEISQLLSSVKGLDEKSIISTCKIVAYDVWFRNAINAFFAKGPEETNPDKSTVENIRIMVERSISFFEKYGPITAEGFTFENDGYTEVVDSGDGDFLTEDTLWDFKVSKEHIRCRHTLQLLMYWIMGMHSKKKEYQSIKKIGVFNPRLNTVYIYELKNYPKELIEDIEKNVICYK